MAFERLEPSHRVLDVAPARAVRFEDPFGRLAKGRHVGPALLGERIAAGRDQRAVARCRLSRLGEPDIGETPEADIASPSASPFRHPLTPNTYPTHMSRR